MHAREHLRLLRRGVEESGGTITSVRKLDEIRPAFHGIVEELREQYVLGYYPKDLQHDGMWRKVKVKGHAEAVLDAVKAL